MDISSDLLSAKIQFVNKGNESAMELKPVVRIQDRSYPVRGSHTLQPGRTFSTQYRTKKHPFQEPGSYYLPLHLSYRDQNGFRFKLPYLIRMAHGDEKKLPGLNWKVSRVVLPKDDNIQVTLINMDSWDKTIHLSNIMAMGIELEMPASPIELAAKEKRTWDLKVKYDSIWPNIYVSYLMAEYSHQGHHYMSYTPLRMQIIPEASVGAWLFERQVMAIVLICLIAIAIVGGSGPLIYRKLWQKHS
ncbi:MAG: hypothetical protein HQM14_14445 [SAR324 cluster bacterium]|nr:hypothetical protein [SAR324 cluster bacterium]